MSVCHIASGPSQVSSTQPLRWATKLFPDASFLLESNHASLCTPVQQKTPPGKATYLSQGMSLQRHALRPLLEGVNGWWRVLFRHVVRGGLGARFGSAPAPCPPPGTCLQRMPASHGGESICNRKDRGTGAGSPPPFRGQAAQYQIQMGIPSRDRSGWSSTCACAVVVLEEKCGGHAARGMEPNRRAR